MVVLEQSWFDKMATTAILDGSGTSRPEGVPTTTGGIHPARTEASAYLLPVTHLLNVGFDQWVIPKL